MVKFYFCSPVDAASSQSHREDIGKSASKSLTQVVKDCRGILRL